MPQHRAHTNYLEEKARRVRSMIRELNYGPDDPDNQINALTQLAGYAQCLVNEANLQKQFIENRKRDQ